MKREKTALDVTVSDKEKQDTYTKLMREQTAVLQHKQESQRKQEEMVSQNLPTVIQTWSIKFPSWVMRHLFAFLILFIPDFRNT